MITLEEMTVKLMNEDFRDIDIEIDEIEDQLYDLINSVDFSVNFNDLLNYEFNEDEFYEEDIIKGKELQEKLKNLYAEREKEYNNEIKNLPPKTNKTSFEGFDITKTAPSYEEDFLPGAEYREYMMNKHHLTDAYIAEITPDDYLLLCGKYGWKDRFNNIEDIYKNTPEPELIDEYVEKFKKGEKAPMPVLNVKNLSQEGRHRAMAAKKAGIKTIPCLILV